MYLKSVCSGQVIKVRFAVAKGLQRCAAQFSGEAAVNISVCDGEDQPCPVFTLCAYAAVAVQNF